MSRTPTKEQQACITAIAYASMLQIRACAGSGKTTTLNMMAESQPVESLYLAFNKQTAAEAAARFPGHVTCRTTHSMAYSAFGAKLRDKLSRPKGKYVNVAGTGTEIARYYHLESFEAEGCKAVPAAFIGVLVLKTVAAFEQSDQDNISIKMVPTYELREKLFDNVQNVNYIVDQVFKTAKKLWAERTDLKSPVLATHDTYLKLYQLSKPEFHGFEIVYVDEFQDTTPCVLDIIMNQRGKRKIIMVGDARQAIYGWRGAVNAMELIQCEAQLLSQSFRYGQAIADLATTVLERDMVITGNASIDSVAGRYDVVDRTQPYTRLFRTNSALLIAAIEEISNGTEVALEIDVKDFVKLLQSAVALRTQDKRGIKHDKVVPFADWDEFVAEGKHDFEVARISKVVNEGKAADWIELLETFHNSKTPLVTFTTAHKSKGREWKQVIVEEDFKSPISEEGEWIGLSIEEQNLLYVALTRAIERLQYNATVAAFIRRDRQRESDSFQVKQLMKTLKAEGPGNGHVVLEDDEYEYC